jgi:tripartite-type tricarboxylate transporter receptor subunit TctC
MSRFIESAAIIVWLSLSNTAVAQPYPNRDITFIVPYGPGGSTDPLSRYFSNALEKILKTNVNVENKPGGSASIGTSAMVRAKPDGYTIGLGTNASLAFQPLINKGLIYKSSDDYAPIAKLVDLPTLIIVRNDAPWKTFDLLKNTVTLPMRRGPIFFAKKLTSTALSFQSYSNF